MIGGAASGAASGAGAGIIGGPIGMGIGAGVGAVIGGLSASSAASAKNKAAEAAQLLAKRQFRVSRKQLATRAVVQKQFLARQTQKIIGQIRTQFSAGGSMGQGRFASIRQAGIDEALQRAVIGLNLALSQRAALVDYQAASVGIQGQKVDAGSAILSGAVGGAISGVQLATAAGKIFPGKTTVPTGTGDSSFSLFDFGAERFGAPTPAGAGSISSQFRANSGLKTPFNWLPTKQP